MRGDLANSLTYFPLHKVIFCLFQLTSFALFFLLARFLRNYYFLSCQLILCSKFALNPRLLNLFSIFFSELPRMKKSSEQKVGALSMHVPSENWLYWECAHWFDMALSFRCAQAEQRKIVLPGKHSLNRLPVGFWCTVSDLARENDACMMPAYTKCNSKLESFLKHEKY